MLYERWRKIVADHAGERALRDTGTGRTWTFGELAAAAERGLMTDSPVVFPEGAGADFVLSVLRGWRTNRIVCPLEPGQARPPIHSLPANCAHLKTTSATGGNARMVAFTAAQLAADAENIVATMGLRPDRANFGVISLAHSYGFSNLVLPLLLHGIPLILAPAPLPEIVRRSAEGEPALALPAVPALWRAWHEAGAIPPNVRLAISAGSPLPLRLEQQVFAATGLKIHNFLGSSECGGIAYDITEKPRANDADVGIALQKVTLGINADGCLTVRSAAVGQTYWSEPSQALAGGVFQTSDLAELRNGHVYLRGRRGDVINVAGRKLSPESVEQVLSAHPAVRDCLVFGVPSQDAERTETIVAVVAGAASEAELKPFLLARLPAWQLPRYWQFVDALAGNRREKVSRAEWRQRYLKEARPEK